MGGRLLCCFDNAVGLTHRGGKGMGHVSARRGSRAIATSHSAQFYSAGRVKAAGKTTKQKLRRKQPNELNPGVPGLARASTESPLQGYCIQGKVISVRKQM